jgi:hypothetical protein
MFGWWLSGAGEGIRTLDPNLGKVAIRRGSSTPQKDKTSGNQAATVHALRDFLLKNCSQDFLLVSNGFKGAGHGCDR